MCLQLQEAFAGNYDRCFKGERKVENYLGILFFIHAPTNMGVTKKIKEKVEICYWWWLKNTKKKIKKYIWFWVRYTAD